MPSRTRVTGTLSYQHRDGSAYPWKDYETSYYSTENLDIHAGNNLPLNTSGDDGGPLLIIRNEDVVLPGYLSTGSYRGTYAIRHPNNFTHKSVTLPSNSTLNAKGTTAIARTLPTNSAFEMSTFLGEILTGGLPAITGLSTMRNRAQVARSAGQEYLNVQFGWLPLISDIREFAKAVRDSHEILESYHKGSGKKIRRRYIFPESKDETRFYKGSFFPSNHVPSWVWGTLVEQYSSRTWFSGAFRYHIPVGTSTLDKFARWRSDADRLLGVSIDPETLWNIAPWSWAVDWFTNTGDVMTNISAMGKDGLVLQYGYVMHHSMVKSFSTGSYGSGTPSSRLYKKEYKMRLAATPYGFGISSTSFTKKQAAIVAALGLSRT